MNKKSKIILIGLFFIALIIAVLLYNKSRMTAKAKNDIQSNFAVAVALVVKGDAVSVEPVVGTIMGNHDVAIVAETQGKVTAVFAEIGDTRTAGSPIVQVDDELKKAAFIAAEVNYEKAKKDYERFEALAKDSSVTAQQFEGIRLAYKSAESQYIAARRQYQDAQIKTPISGIVTSRTVDIGSMVQQGMVIANVVDLSLLKVKVNIAESDAFKIHSGDSVEVTTDVYPGIVYHGSIRSIGAKADEAHTYPVEVRLPNSVEHALKAGMFARVNFRSSLNASALVIPRIALLGSVRKPQVYIVENGIATLRNVVVGAEAGTTIEILNGLKEGDKVVVNGQTNLKDSVTIAINE